jgi:AraC family transcriptional regulator
VAEVLRAAECRQPALLYPNAPPSDTIAAAIGLIDERLAEPLRIATLAAAVRLSPAQFHVRFLEETGFTPADFWSRRRLAKAQALLADPQLSITDIALTLGFSTSQYFATFFRRFTGTSPRDYRRRLNGG